MPPAARRERGVVKMIKYETTRTGLIVNYSYAFISPDSGPESPDVFLHPGRDEGPVVRVTITTSKSRKRRALVAQT